MRRKGFYREADAADLIRATLSGVQHLHDHGIVHYHLKPENILFPTQEDNAEPLIHICDEVLYEVRFEISTKSDPIIPTYLAPEMLGVEMNLQAKPVYVFLALNASVRFSPEDC